MSAILQQLREFTVASLCLRLVIAIICGGVIGLGRERHGRAAGLRTHVLVCLGSSLTALIGVFTAANLGFDADPLRISAQVVSGIGFLGVGTIIVTGKFHVTGLTTAAGLWATAAIGIASGVGFVEGALICTLFAVLAMLLLSKLEGRMLKNPKKLFFYVELNDVAKIQYIQRYLANNYLATMEVTAPRSAVAGNVGLEISLRRQRGKPISGFLVQLEQMDCVVYGMQSR